MPFVRGRLTHSSRLMVPVHTALSFGVAWAYIFGDPDRTATPSFDAARNVMSIRGFGFIFAVVFLIELVGMLSKREEVFVIGLATGMGVAGAWSGFFILSIIFTDNASLTGFQLWGYVALAHLATFLSLTKDTPTVTRSVRARERSTD